MSLLRTNRHELVEPRPMWTWWRGLGLLVMLLGVVACRGVAAPVIVGLPKSVEPAYDLSLVLQVSSSGSRPLTVKFEDTYRLTVTPEGWQWQPLRAGRPGTATAGRWMLRVGMTYSLTLKRRAGNAALLLNHRLERIVSAPTAPQGSVSLSEIPTWAHLDDARYLAVGPRIFGDDFMRPEVRERFLQHPTPWFDDSTWQVAWYRKAWPSEDPRDPVTARPMTIPWQLGVMQNTRTTPNGFWYLYTGTGPSWVVANPQMVPPSWDRYSLQAAVKPEYGSAVGLIAAYQSNAQYLLFRWEQAAADAGPRAFLYEVIDGQPRLLATARPGFHPRQWYTLRLNLAWETIEVWVDGIRLLTIPNPGWIEGRVGLLADGATTPVIPSVDAATAALYATASTSVDPSWTMQTIPCIYFDDVRVTDWDGASPAYAVARAQSLPEQLYQDRYTRTFTSAEALWTPSIPPPAQNIPSELGAAAPCPTDVPGLYWHKGRHYHELTVSLPLAGVAWNGQTVHLTNGSDAHGGYRIVLTTERGQRRLQFYRQQRCLRSLRVSPSVWTALRIERRNDEVQLILVASEEAGASRDRQQVALRYRDPQPLTACEVGVTVTDASLPAARIHVMSDWRQETFTTAPTAWRTEHGVWGTMTRYACDPAWNWFGGYGATTPTAWLKPALQGDQSVEAYLGIKMEYDNAAQEAATRFRDLNLSICADGRHPMSGYTLARSRLVDGKAVTQLWRRGTVVWSSSAPADLLPTPKAGYRAWSALRLVKTGPSVAIYLDNRLAGTYLDPDPLPGGYAAVWTVNNGMVIGRVNYAAETMQPDLLFRPEDTP